MSVMRFPFTIEALSEPWCIVPCKICVLVKVHSFIPFPQWNESMHCWWLPLIFHYLPPLQAVIDETPCPPNVLRERIGQKLLSWYCIAQLPRTVTAPALIGSPFFLQEAWRLVKIWGAFGSRIFCRCKPHNKGPIKEHRKSLHMLIVEVRSSFCGIVDERMSWAKNKRQTREG